MRLNPNDLAEGTVSEEIVDDNPLKKLVPAYGNNKAQSDSLDKIIEAQNLQIKELMASSDLSSYEAGGFIATVSTTTQSSFNSAKLLEVIKADDALASQVIKTQEYVDMDSLEELIYADKISRDMLLKMDKCKESKTITTLRIKKSKKKKGD